MQRHPLLSRPIDIHWAGWQANTYALQREGWELSADQNLMHMAMRIAMRNQDLRCVAVTEMFEDFRFEQYARDYGKVPPLRVQYFACHIQVMKMHELKCMSFQPIDAAPQLVSDTTVHSYEDLKWFAAPLVETKELIVDPDKVSDILAKIAEAQLPEQEAIRKRAALRASREGMALEGMPRRQFHAQVLSIAA